MTQQDELKVQGLSKFVGDFILHADFTVKQGERAALFGPSGSGKTTLLRLIAGLETPDAGQVWMGSQDITALPSQKRDIGYLFQDQALFPALSVLENAAFGLKVRGVSKAEREEAAHQWLTRVGLDSRAHAKVQTLSGGEKQRVAFVRAVMWKPKLLLLDEPFSALDPSLRQSLREELLKLHDLHPVPMILVTHDEADIAALASVHLKLEGGSQAQRRVTRAS